MCSVHNELSNLNGQMMIKMVILIISMCKLCRFTAPGLKAGDGSKPTDTGLGPPPRVVFDFEE